MTEFLKGAKSIAGKVKQLAAQGAYLAAVDVLVVRKAGDRRKAWAALVLAANITPEEQSQLRDWLDAQEGATR